MAIAPVYTTNAHALAITSKMVGSASRALSPVPRGISAVRRKDTRGIFFGNRLPGFAPSPPAPFYR